MSSRKSLRMHMQIAKPTIMLCPPISKPKRRAMCSRIMRSFFNRAMTSTRSWQSSRCDHQSRWSLRSTVCCQDNGAHSLLRRRFVVHTSVLQHVRPLPTLALMTVFQMLAKVVCSIELFGLVAFSKLVDVVQMLGSNVPLWWIGEFFAAIATNIGTSRR